MQNPATFLSALLLKPKTNDNILDMCAAPGGKSMMIQSITKNKSNVTACEINNIRFEKMVYNFKIQNENVYSLNKDARELNDNLKFDKILIDAPCSGSGTFDISDDKYEKYFTEILIEQIQSQYLNNPQQLSVEELLYAATLTDNLNEQKKIYQKTTFIVEKI